MSKQAILNVQRVGDACGDTIFLALTTGKYDHDTTRELIAHWVLMHEIRLALSRMIVYIWSLKAFNIVMKGSLGIP